MERIPIIPWTLAVLVSLQNAAAQPANVQLREVATFNSAIGLANAGDGSGRLFVVRQSGQVLVWDGNQVLATPFLDVSGLTHSGGERGLLGLAFHPDYETNGFFYVNYTDLTNDTVVARYTVSGNPNVADPSSSQVVLTFAQPAGNHNGGDLHFGPDGFLYVSSGDGGSDACSAQDDGSLLGKILRIDVDGDDFPADPDANYAVPADNPRVGVAGAREEIWSLGLRNPWRFSFDRRTGDIFIGDVGESTWEDVHLELASSAGGENYGWPFFEGEAAFSSCAEPASAPAACDDAGFSCPILTLHHGDGNCAITGGFRYRGQDYPGLEGFYFYTDWCEGTLWAAAPDGGGWTSYAVASTSGFGPTGFGEDENGELYLVNGFQLFQVTGGFLFEDGFEDGTVDAWSAAVP